MGQDAQYPVHSWCKHHVHIIGKDDTLDTHYITSNGHDTPLSYLACSRSVESLPRGTTSLSFKLLGRFHCLINPADHVKGLFW